MNHYFLIHLGKLAFLVVANSLHFSVNNVQNHHDLEKERSIRKKVSAEQLGGVERCISKCSIIIQLKKQSGKGKCLNHFLAKRRWLIIEEDRRELA